MSIEERAKAIVYAAGDGAAFFGEMRDDLVDRVAAALREAEEEMVGKIAGRVRKWKDDNMDRLGRETRWELDDVAGAIERGDWKATPSPSS